MFLKIKGSGSERIRELYKKTTTGVKTSGTFDKSVKAAGNEKVSTAKPDSKKGTSEATYDNVFAQIDAKTEQFAVKTVASAPDVRQAKVDAIAAAIKNKTYKVDFEAVAERMLAAGLFDEK